MRDLDVREFMETVFEGWRLLLCSSLFFGLVGVWVAVTSTHVYRSQAVIAATPQFTSRAGFIGGSSLEMFGLNSLTQKAGRPTRVNMALEVLKSREFLVTFARDRKIVPELLAVDHWDPVTGQLVLDSQLYNRETNKWVQWGGVQLSKPSDMDVFVSLLERIIIKRTDKNGIYKIAIEHESPVLAALWVGWIIEDLNQRFRLENTHRAAASIQRINNQLLAVSDVTIRRFLLQVIEGKTLDKMLIETEKNYVFEVLDPAIAPSSRIRPKKLLISSRWASLGVLVALFILFFKVLFLAKKQD